jgi:hypothetical protein
MHVEQATKLFLVEIGQSPITPKPPTEVFGKSRRLHLDALPSVADLDLEAPQRRHWVVNPTTIEPPGHSSQQLTWLGFDPGGDLDDRVELRHPKPALEQADLRTV